ncbi:MAG TPA: DNA polymerase IV, partial [Agriterribacter sp.]|nr:DNA polymerase IV [Agriterribacter sp.]
ELVAHFGKPGRFYYQVVRGIDNREVQPHRETKSVSVEDTYQEDLTTKEAMLPELKALSGTLTTRIQSFGLKGRTITIKFKFHDFTIMTRSHSLPVLVDDQQEVFSVVKMILDKAPVEEKRIRLLGVGISNFELPHKEELKVAGNQLRLF